MDFFIIQESYLQQKIIVFKLRILSVAHWYPSGFWFQGDCCFNPGGEKIFPFLFLSHNLMIALYNRTRLGVGCLYANIIFIVLIYKGYNFGRAATRVHGHIDMSPF